MTQNITFTFNCKFQHFSPVLLSQPWPFKSSSERTTFWEGSILCFLPVHLPLLHHHLHLLPLPHLHLLPLPHLHLLHLQILLQGNHPLPKERDQMSWHRLLSTTTEYRQQVDLWLWNQETQNWTKTLNRMTWVSLWRRCQRHKEKWQIDWKTQ